MEPTNITLPGSVLASAGFVMSRAADVTIDTTCLEDLSTPILSRLERGTDSVEAAFGSTGNLEGDVNLIMFETAANFCFWAQDDTDKWTIQRDDKPVGGWYGLAGAFYQAFLRGTAVHDAGYMATLTIRQAHDIFQGGTHSGAPYIPLLEQRVNNIIEVARYLQAVHGGSGLTFVRSAGMSAPSIAAAAAVNLPSFRDGAYYPDKNGSRWVWLLKRAQILAGDLSQLTQKYPEFVINDIDQLTAFADYRLPQVLRHYGVLRYSERLTNMIDTKQIIPSGSTPEIELRAATIMACQALQASCGGRSAADIDLALWLLSQDMRADPALKPHHLTIGTFY